MCLCEKLGGLVLPPQLRQTPETLSGFVFNMFVEGAHSALRHHAVAGPIRGRAPRTT